MRISTPDFPENKHTAHDTSAFARHKPQNTVKRYIPVHQQIAAEHETEICTAQPDLVQSRSIQTFETHDGYRHRRAVRHNIHNRNSFAPVLSHGNEPAYILRLKAVMLPELQELSVLLVKGYLF